VGDIAAGIQTGASVYSMGKSMEGPPDGGAGDYGTATAGGLMSGAAPPAGAVLGRSPIARAMSGIEDASNWFGGVNGLDPLHAPGSTWNATHGGTMIGGGQTNAEFNVSQQ
jgi:hypothetical protein